jgi:hypothetical protein
MYSERTEEQRENNPMKRELWLKSLGINAVLPPPEERPHVEIAIGAARAEAAADQNR